MLSHWQTENWVQVCAFHSILYVLEVSTNQPTNSIPFIHSTLPICTFIQLSLFLILFVSVWLFDFIQSVSFSLQWCKKYQRAVDQRDSFYLCFINTYRLWLRFGFTAILCFRAIDIWPIIGKFRSYRIH